LLAHLDHVAGLAAVRTDIDAAAIDLDVAVIDELARGEDRRHELGAIDDGVEARFEQADDMLRRVALAAVRLLVDLAELLLGNIAVMALQLLLGAQLDAEIGQLALAALAVLAGTVFAAVHRGLRTAPDVLAHAAVDLVLCGFALAHRIPFSIRCTRMLTHRMKETRPPLAPLRNLTGHPTHAWRRCPRDLSKKSRCVAERDWRLNSGSMWRCQRGRRGGSPEARQPHRAASIAATSIFFMSIIAAKARRASSPPA